jgi:allophanate hydrolase
VAERYLVARELLERQPDAIHPVTREIISQGAKPSAADAFAALYRLEELRRQSERTFREIDALLLPTAPTAYRVSEVLADPIALNDRLGTYTNFVNLLDLAALAVPAGMRSDGAPSGVTLIAPAGQDALLAGVGRTLHAASGLPLGALGIVNRR